MWFQGTTGTTTIEATVSVTEAPFETLDSAVASSGANGAKAGPPIE